MKFRLSALALLLASPAFAEGELKVYHWFEYIPQELVDKFTAETGIAVTIDTYDSNESMLAALKAGKLGQYDVAVPADFMVAIMGASPGGFGTILSQGAWLPVLQLDRNGLHYPASAIELLQTPEIERYSDEFNPQLNTGTLEIWLPIKA